MKIILSFRKITKYFLKKQGQMSN